MPVTTTGTDQRSDNPAVDYLNKEQQFYNAFSSNLHCTNNKCCTTCQKLLSSRPITGWICVGRATLPAYLLYAGRVQNVAIIHFPGYIQYNDIEPTSHAIDHFKLSLSDKIRSVQIEIHQSSAGMELCAAPYSLWGSNNHKLWWTLLAKTSEHHHSLFTVFYFASRLCHMIGVP